MSLSKMLHGLVLAGGLAALTGCQTQQAQGAAYGEALYGGCVSCHGADGAGNQMVGAPAIAGQGQWYLEAQLGKFKSGARAYHPDDFTGLKMRPMARTLPTDVELKSVAEYVAGMKPHDPVATLEGGDAAAGKSRYTVCTACHGADAAGNQTMNAPSLKELPDWYIMAQLHKFKSGQRGAGPGDTTGMQMRAMAGTLTDDQAIKDVIAYINTL